jgi:hypothetical protein
MAARWPLLALAIVGLTAIFPIGASPPPILAFELNDVQLADETYQARLRDLNTAYLMDGLEADRLLWVFRKNAGLPTPGVPFHGTWEGGSRTEMGQEKPTDLHAHGRGGKGGGLCPWPAARPTHRPQRFNPPTP